MTQLVKHGAALALPPALPPALSPGLPQESLQRQLERAVQSPPVDRLVRRSLLTLAITLLPIAGWATMTVAERAVLSQGQLVPEGRRKTVNLLEPGILRRLMVQEGSVVQAGQPLLQLDVAQAESQAGQAKAAYWSGRARVARLRAEQAEQRQLAFPLDLEAAAGADRAIPVFLRAEQALFAARWAAFDGQVGVQERAITQLQEQVAGAQAQRDGAGRQLMAVREQIAGYSRLLTQGYASRFTVLNLQQQEAGFVATIGQANAQEAQLREGIIQAQRQLEGLRLARLSDIANDLQMTEATTAAALQQLRAAEDVLARREVLSPEAGKVTNIQAFTPGATIQTGQPILDLVPLSDRLVVEGRVQPTDIEQVSVGQRANIRLTSYRARNVPMLQGQVIVVGADVQTPPNGGDPFFLVRVEFDPGQTDSVPDLAPVAGMPAELYILGERRTPLAYLWGPLSAAARRALRD